jgi:hypothetical protein
MTIAIIATVGSPDANSYSTLAEADEFFSGHPYAAAWDQATEDQKTRALVAATRLLDEQWEWDGNVVAETQRLAWPRYGLYYDSGWYILDTVIPEKLKQATAEFARQLLVEDRTADNGIATAGISAISAGSVSVDFTGGAHPAVIVPDAVYFMVCQWGTIRRRGGGQVRLERT